MESGAASIALKRMMKKNIIVSTVMITVLSACGAPEPVPAEAIKYCLDTGGIPNYRSNPVIVEFVCMKPKAPKKAKTMTK